MEGSPCKPDHGTEGGDGFSRISISLRPLDLSDIDAFMVWATDKVVTRFCTWEPHTSKEEGMRFIMDKVIPHPWFRAICLDDTPIGAISVTANSGNDRCRGELGYVLGSKYWGKGIATKAVKMVAETIFKEWPHLERLEALVDVENVGSQRVLEKIGFQREGILRKYFLLKGRTRDMSGYWLCFGVILLGSMFMLGVATFRTWLEAFEDVENVAIQRVLQRSWAFKGMRSCRM
ncbi:FkbH domain containing protein [Parasponia andersonii]|uniref:FkbH domain containing protein n=1 Tax=Parasponia andersonii TaxID=3476 RepID=A0A2P5E3B6_PARAD|nr:FkbH domain containing protein [Parasponia andersonii]